MHDKGNNHEFHRICPWWKGYLLLNPLRWLRQNPNRVLSGMVKDGMTVLEVGPGMGFFSLELARLAGPTGRIIAIDIQEKMLKTLERRARRAGLNERFDLRLARPHGLGVEDAAGRVDFILAFYVVHELPDSDSFFGEAMRALKPGGSMLVSEPDVRVKEAQFGKTIQQAVDAGFRVVEKPVIPMSRSVLLTK